MNFWSKRENPEKPVQTGQSDLAERLRAVESGLRQLDLDFDDLSDRFSRLQGRRAKRAAVDNPEPPAELDRNAAISEQIRKRRQGIMEN